LIGVFLAMLLLDSVVAHAGIDVFSVNLKRDAGTTASLTYNSGASPAQLGQPLEIRLLAVDFTDEYEVAFDDVKLSRVTSDAVTVTLTLAVNNVGRLDPPVQDTMTIDVYDDACKAAIGKGLAADNPTDIDGNCITGLADFAVMATKWLTDNALTAPVAK